MTFTVTCPKCRYAYKNLDQEDVFEMPEGKCCDKCGVLFRVIITSPDEICDKCGHSCENEDEIESVRAEPLCGKYSPHQWHPTLATDMEKCAKCNDIQRIPIPVSA
ncbi:hypothetical protein KW797_01395 [Candidatus Parcubacteria bacterium]|nr:hypothetical protein [Candidatus Parcubacteria bacterium]